MALHLRCVFLLGHQHSKSQIAKGLFGWCGCFSFGAYPREAPADKPDENCYGQNEKQSCSTSLTHKLLLD
jgi:hypothetical protein